MKKQSLRRSCPRCGKNVYYSTPSSFSRAKRRISRCTSCSLIGNVHCKKRVPWNIGLTSESDDRVKKYSNSISNSLTGKIQSQETIQKRISKIIGRKNTPQTIYKMESSAVKRIQEYGSKSRGYNISARSFIDNINTSLGFHFQHALNGGEVVIANKFVDGYDKTKNIVFEYDEPAHHRPSYKIKDENKQRRIIDAINPSMFIRYDEKNNRLYDSLTNIDIPTNPPILL